MDGLARAIGAPSHVVYKGSLTPIHFRLIEIGEIENFLLSKKDPYLKADEIDNSDLDDDIKTGIRRDVDEFSFDCYVSAVEINDFIRSRAGIAFIIWMNVRSGGDKFEDILEWANLLGWKDIAKIRREISRAGGIDELSNIDWPPPVNDSKKKESSPRTNWKLMVRNSFENGIGCDDFSKLTMHELRCVGSEANELQDKTSVSKEEWFGMSKEDRAAFVAKKKRYKNRMKGRK